MSENRSHKSVKPLAGRNRMLRALELRGAGKTYEHIAEALGYAGPSGAYNAVSQLLREHVQEPADEVRALEVHRLDTMLRGIWPAVESGNYSAIQTALKIMDRRAKLLGIDAPSRVDVNIRQEVEKLARESGLDVEAVLSEVERILVELNE